jgi:RNA polymerase sigma-54 factor
MGKQRLEQNQKLNLSPQQIQFLSLLQIPVVELEKRIQEELEENPALEEGLDEEEDEVIRFEKESTNYSKSTNNNNQYFQVEDKKESLSEYLHSQLNTLNVKENIRFLISYLINSLDQYGYLNRNLYSICDDLLISNGLTIKIEEINKALAVLKGFDPCGVGAQDLQECLLIQLKKLFPKKVLAKNIIENFYTDFTNKNFEKIYKQTSINQGELKKVYDLIESLNPSPSRGFSKSAMPNEYISADFTVLLEQNNQLELSLNKPVAKNLKISLFYKNLLSETKDKKTVSFLKTKLDQANWFIESLIKRDVTLRKVMRAIIKTQKSYFISGKESDLIPMKLADIASIVNMDISTISRVSNAKYVETFFGTFKLKELFSEAYRKDNGEVVSTKEIKKKLADLINNEDTTSPYTDEKLCEILGKNDYHIARRTVAKYRENLGFQTSKIRRKL